MINRYIKIIRDFRKKDVDWFADTDYIRSEARKNEKVGYLFDSLPTWKLIFLWEQYRGGEWSKPNEESVKEFIEWCLEEVEE